MIRYYSNITIISFFMVESPNNYENLNPQTESNENSEFLESINNDLQSIPEELQNLAQKQVEQYKESPQSSNDEYDLLDSIDALKAIESIKDSNDWYEEFIDLLDNSENLKPLFTKIILEQVAINNYIKENWFPINQETLDAFNNNFWLKINYIKEDTVEKKEDSVENNQDSVENNNEAKELYLKTYERIKEIETENEYFNKLKELFEKLNNNEIDVKEITEFLNSLEEEKFFWILKEIQNYDDLNNTNIFNWFKDAIISSWNSNIILKINKYEQLNSPEKTVDILDITDSETARIYAWLWTENPDINWNIFKNWDISIDISKRPPQRILWDENFNIELDLPIWDFYPAILEHERTKQEITPKLDSVNILLQNKEYIDDMLGSNLNISQIKTNLKNTLNIKTDFINTKEDLSDTNLANLKNEFEQQLSQNDEKLQQALREKINEYKRKLEQKDKLARETYNFLKSIGFDKIPQSVTNNVIQQLNSNSWLRASLGLNTNIDLKNGILWFDSDFDENSISSQEKADFAKVFNVMIAWNEEWPINIDAILNDRWTPISDYTVFENHLESNKLRDAWLANKIMIDNIKNYNNENK